MNKKLALYKSRDFITRLKFDKIEPTIYPDSNEFYIYFKIDGYENSQIEIGIDLKDNMTDFFEDGNIDEEKIELDADTEFTLPLKHLIQKHVKEVLTKKAKVSDFVDDFKKSDAKQFKGKSLDKIKKMALAAFLSKQKK